MAEGKKQKRPRRSFTEEFKAGAIRLVLDEGKAIPQVARDLDLTESSVRNWVERARADRGKGKPGVLTTAEKEELATLRKEVRQLRLERDILKKAAALMDPHEFMAHARATAVRGIPTSPPFRRRARAARPGARAW
jgi:transposase